MNGQKKRVTAAVVAAIATMLKLVKLSVAGTVALVLGAGIALAGGGPIVEVNKDCSLNPKAVCNGTDQNDDFEGEDVDDGVQGARDFIEGGIGVDGGDGNGGRDKMFGGPGVDGAINDLQGDDGRDLVSGGAGDDDELEGNNGNDIVMGGNGDDFEVDGGVGDDVVLGGSGDDFEVNGGEGDDEVLGGSGDDGGEVGIDTGLFTGGSGDNTVRGGEGGDFIQASESFPGDKEFIFGGDGKDTINAADSDGKDIVDCGDGNDTVFFDQGLDKLSNCENKIAS